MVAPDALTGQGKVLTEPMLITLAGQPARVTANGATKRVTGDDGTEREVPLGLAVEILPVVRRSDQGVVMTLNCTVTHTISTSDGVATRTVQKSLAAPPGERHVIRLTGEGNHAPMTVVITPRVVDRLDVAR